MIDLKQKLIENGFTVNVESKKETCLSRPTIVGAPVDAKTGIRIDVFVKIQRDTCSFAINAFNGDCWCAAEMEDMTHEYLFKHLKTIEQRVVYAWRELRD